MSCHTRFHLLGVVAGVRVFYRRSHAIGEGFAQFWSETVGDFFACDGEEGAKCKDEAKTKQSFHHDVKILG